MNLIFPDTQGKIQVRVSKNTKAVILKVFGGLMLLLITVFIGLFLSVPIPVIYKLGLILLPGVLLFFTLNPFWVISLFLLFRPELELFSKAGLLKFFSAFTIIFTFFLVTTNKGKFNFCWARLKYLYVFILVSTVSALYSIEIRESLVATLRILSFVCAYLLVFNLIDSQEDGIKLLSCFPLAAVFPLTYGFYQLASGQSYVVKTTQIERVSSLFVLANSFARFLFVVLLASIPLFLYLNKKKKIILAMILAFTASTIALLGVRSVWAMLAFSVLVLAWFLPKVRRYLLILTPVVLLAFGGTFIKGSQTILNPDSHRKYGDSAQWRLEMWDQLINRAIVKKPMLGYGAGTSEKVGAIHTDFAKHPHNDYLRTLVETGVLGFIPFLLFLMSNIASSYKDIRTYKENKYLNVCAFALFSSLGVTMLAANVFYAVTFMWYLFGYLGITHKLNLLSQTS